LRIVRIVGRRVGMEPLDQSVRDAFLVEARKCGVAAAEVWDYVKWLRYYLDFCAKYRHETLDRDSLQAFLLKLASKNQSAGQQAQAARSVRFYLELAAPRAATAPAIPAIVARAVPPAPPPVAPASSTPRAAPPAQPRPPARAKTAVFVGRAR
jgi:hypothetical protein